MLSSVVAGVVLMGSQEASELRVMMFNVLTGGNANSQFDKGSPLHGKSRAGRIAEIVEGQDVQVAFICEEYENKELRAALEEIGLRRVTSGPRGSSMYSRLPALQLETSVASMTWGEIKFVAKVEHWPPSPYGPNIVQESMAKGDDIDEKWVLEQSDKRKFYADSYRMISPYLSKGVDMIMAGDFNEPSHLDWTARYARLGADRWVANPLKSPLRMKVAWKGSRLLTSPSGFSEELGLKGRLVGLTDAFREVHPDEVKVPGDTWTPRYTNGTEGRRLYDASPTDEVPVPLNQVNDRIDMVYYRAGARLKAKDAWVVGETGSRARVAVDGFPSDHRAVVVVFERAK